MCCEIVRVVRVMQASKHTCALLIKQHIIKLLCCLLQTKFGAAAEEDSRH